VGEVLSLHADLQQRSGRRLAHVHGDGELFRDVNPDKHGRLFPAGSVQLGQFIKRNTLPA